MNLKFLTIFALNCILFCGCAATLPVKESGENNALVAIRSQAGGSYFIGIGLGLFGDEPLEFILNNKNTNQEYVCKKFNGMVCIAANIPAGEYEVTSANSPLKQPIVGTPVKVELGEYKFDITVKSDVNYVGKYVIKTEQEGSALKVSSWEKQNLSDEDNAMMSEILAKSPESGWKMSTP